MEHLNTFASVAPTLAQADKLDGQQGSYYYPASNPNGFTNDQKAHTVTGGAFSTTAAPDSVLEYAQASAITDTKVAPSTDWHNSIRMGHGDPYNYYSSTIAVGMAGANQGDLYTQVIAGGYAQGWNRHWHNNNDGAGSGLDADLLDGLQGASYLRSDATDSASGRVSFTSMPQAGGVANSAGGLGSIEVSGDTTKAAMISFHRAGVHAAYLGLDTDNKWKVGGWSMGANAYELWHSGNDGAGSGLDADKLDGLHGSSYTNTGLTNATAAGKEKLVAKWVKFSATGSILDDSGISTVTRTATGKFTIGFNSGYMVNTNYTVNFGSQGQSGSMRLGNIVGQYTTYMLMETLTGNGSRSDPKTAFYVQIVGAAW